MPAPSTPCIHICAVDSSTGLCTGCGRTMDEIARWSEIGESERLRLMKEARARLARMAAPVPQRRF